jgi:hypothetical protein
MIYTTVSEPTQPTETNPITLPLHNWEALHQIEKEQESLVLQGTVSSAVAAGTGVFGNPLGFFIFALAYRPLIRLEKLARIVKVMRVLLEQFQDMGILVFPCLQVPEHEPIDLFVIFPEKIHLLISIRSKGDCKIVFNEGREILYTKHEKKGLRRWLPCPLVELSGYHSWLGKNRRTFGISANAIRKYPVIKALILWKPTRLERHREHLYNQVAEMPILALSRKGTALVIEEEDVLSFVRANLAHNQAKVAK